MNYAEIKTFDIANGPGVRTSLFVSGCLHHCPGCFNESAWDFSAGLPFTEDTVKMLLEACRPDYIKGLSLLGGEPMEPSNQAVLLPFLQEFRKEFPQKSVWCYSGFTYEELRGLVPSRAFCQTTEPLLRLIDVLVDGRFIQSEYDITLRFRGSRNQRLLDIPKSLAEGHAVLWEDDPVFAVHELAPSITCSQINNR